jgi:hypothetical protein
VRISETVHWDRPSMSKFARSCCFCSRVNLCACIVQVHQASAKANQIIACSVHVIA